MPQPFVNQNKRLAGSRRIEHKFDRKIRRNEDKESKEQEKAVETRIKELYGGGEKNEKEINKKGEEVCTELAKT